jgi:outer membrane protein assembly factor BamA
MSAPWILDSWVAPALLVATLGLPQVGRCEVPAPAPVEPQPETAPKVNLIQRVTYLGAKHLSDEELEEITFVHCNAPISTLNKWWACEHIVRRYNEDGRPFAECRLIKGDKPGDTEVVFQIIEGPVVTVKSLSFVGNRFVSGPVLATHVQSAPP